MSGEYIAAVLTGAIGGMFIFLAFKFFFAFFIDLLHEEIRKEILIWHGALNRRICDGSKTKKPRV